MWRVEESAPDFGLVSIKQEPETEPELDYNHDSRSTHLYPDTVRIKHEEESADPEQDIFSLLRYSHLNDTTTKEEVDNLTNRDAIDDENNTWDLDETSISSVTSNYPIASFPDKPEEDENEQKPFDHTLTTECQFGVPTKTRAEKMTFDCKLCNNATPCLCISKGHMTKRTKERRFPCKFCNFAAVYPKHLKTHEMTHVKEKRFTCKLCNYATTRQRLVKLHELKHTGKKAFKCKFCSYVTPHPINLKFHEIIHVEKKRVIDDFFGSGSVVKYE